MAKGVAPPDNGGRVDLVLAGCARTVDANEAQLSLLPNGDDEDSSDEAHPTLSSESRLPPMDLTSVPRTER